MTEALHLHPSNASMLSTETNLTLPHIVFDGYKSGLVYSIYFIYSFIYKHPVCYNVTWDLSKNITNCK